MLSKAVNVICTFEYFSPARGTLRNVNDRSKRSNRALWKFLANAWQVCCGEGSFPVWVTCVTWPSTCSHHSQHISVTLSEKFFVTIYISSASLVCLKSLCHNLCLQHISRLSEKYFCNNLYLRLISVRLKKIVYLQFVFHLRPSVWKVFCHNLYLQLISLKKFLLTPSQLIWKTPYLCSPKVFKFCKSYFVSQIIDIGRPFHSTLQLAEQALKRQQDQDPENFMKA